MLYCSNKFNCKKKLNKTDLENNIDVLPETTKGIDDMYDRYRILAGYRVHLV